MPATKQSLIFVDYQKNGWLKKLKNIAKKKPQKRAKKIFSAAFYL